jgi:hypothetical protein
MHIVEGTASLSLHAALYYQIFYFLVVMPYVGWVYVFTWNDIESRFCNPHVVIYLTKHHHHHH